MAEFNSYQVAIQVGIAKKHISLAINCIKAEKMEDCTTKLETAVSCLDNLGNILKDMEAQEFGKQG